MLKQRMFSVDDALARQPGVDRAAVAADLERLEKAGVIVATEMR
jgi:biotin operon repressor